MLSIEESRRILGNTARDMSDEEIRNIRDSLLELATIATDAFEEEKRQKCQLSEALPSDESPVI